ncbi:MAG: hypothetical protein K2J72_02435 [Oscillospiraceae bacterium]|nr:hypothetical protein [Oscillospiraceae bacterium]
MNITSMDMNSLFHTLMGKAPTKPVMGSIKKENKKDEFIHLNEDLNTAVNSAKDNANKDTFTKKSDEITPEADSVYDLMDYDSSLDCKVRGNMTRAQLATHFGEIAKRLDAAYSEGKFTKEEYDELNAGLMESYDKYISRCEYAAAGKQVGIIRMLERRKQSKSGTETDTADVPKQKRNIDKILDGMKEHRMSLRERHKMQETATVLAMLAALERNSGGDDSKWRKLADDLRQTLREAVKTVEDNSEKTAETVKIPEKVQENSQEKSAESEQTEESGETLGGRKICPSIDPETVKRIGDEIHQQTTEFAEKHCRVDRDQMRAMLDTVRRGGSVPGGNDDTFGGERYKDWYNEGYTFVVYT